jgi:sigma-E factor negative regulatory protein RseA
MMSDAMQDAEQLSALADGELDAAGVARVCSRWPAGEQFYRTWHAYHLIGDVLRSDDLARAPQNDQRALDGLRRRLADEPTVLAPATAIHVSPAGWSRRRARTWGAVATVAAGFAAVMVVLTALHTGGAPEVASGNLAAAPLGPHAAGPIVLSGASRTGDREPLALTADGKLVRDVRLDRYLDAHKHFSGSSALGVPSSFLRGATSDASNR